MFFLSAQSSKGNMLSTPSPLSLPACLCYSFIAHGLRELLAFWMPPPSHSLCKLTLIGSSLLPPYEPHNHHHHGRTAWGVSSQLSAGAATKKEKEKVWGKILTRGKEIVRCFTAACLSISPLFLSAFPAVMRINGIQHISLMSLSDLFAEPCPLPHNCPAVSLHPLFFHRDDCSTVTQSSTTSIKHVFRDVHNLKGLREIKLLNHLVIQLFWS